MLPNMTNIKSSSAAPARYTAAPTWRLLVLSLAFLISSKETTAFTSQLPSTALRHPKQHHVVLLSSSSDDDATSKLLEKARKLREEVSAVEQSKAEVQKQNDAKAQAQREAEMEEQKQKDQQRLRYSAEVPILKDMGDEVMERVDFPPRLKGGKSRIVTIQAPLPLGLVLGEDESIPGMTSVDEVAAEGNGAAAGVKQGDIVRAITACQTTMETPTWQLLAGGIGQPKTKRFMYSVDGRPFEEVLDAIGSNRMDVQGRDVWLVLERMD
mmetsp:Transcript_36887/g.75193  ORF Transcript_36887/g.75193 Transcript_36887/m.75193 type:complete len:268 (+) Transcript_36887:99-902(+)